MAFFLAPFVPIIVQGVIRLAAKPVAKELIKKGFQKASSSAVKKAGGKQGLRKIFKTEANKLKTPSRTKSLLPGNRVPYSQTQATKELLATTGGAATIFAVADAVRPDRKLTAAEEKARKRRKGGRKGGRTKIDPTERVDEAESVARLTPKQKTKPKKASEKASYGMLYDAASKQKGPDVGQSSQRTKKKSKPDMTLGEYFGNLEGRKRTVKTPLGKVEIDSTSDAYDYDVGHKHGGKVGKGKKKAKSTTKIRKRAALRGWGKAKRGY